jgi:hypothetical protein
MAARNAQITITRDDFLGGIEKTVQRRDHERTKIDAQPEDAMRALLPKRKRRG